MSKQRDGYFLFAACILVVFIAMMVAGLMDSYDRRHTSKSECATTVAK